MDFIDKIRELALQIPKHRQYVKTEEGTKNAMVMPFITALGYNVNDPTEVTPEFVADFGARRGEKIDYAILKDGKVAMLVECKCCQDDLDSDHAAQLFRYFSVGSARFGILTNGIAYRFYTDLEAPNKMDANPFFEFNMLDFSDYQIEELKQFTKPSFNEGNLLTAASELKLTGEIRRILAEQLKKPSEEFVRFFVKQISTERMTANVRERFTEFTRKAFSQFINDSINQRLMKAALVGTQEMKATEIAQEINQDRRPETTAEELDGFYVVKAILREVIPAKRIVPRDALSYFSVLLNDNNRKPLCRMYFNGKTKYIGLFDHNRIEEKVKVAGVDDIYSFADRLKATIAVYDKQGERDTV